MADQQILLKSGILEWAAMQDAIHNSVVQVVSQVAKFNWREPYIVQEQYEGRGTGFFIDTDGYLVTNAHVVDSAETVWVYLPSLGKKVIFAQVVSFCPDRDLALLRIKDEDFKELKKNIGEIVPLPLGDSDIIRRTDEVLVLGYPLGHQSMKSSTGVISGRESYGGYSLIQITAPVNPGNSGGPLLNAQGEVIGITIATIPGAQNIGFAIPINQLKIILDDLYSKPFVRRGQLGLLFNYASEELAQLLGNPLPTGIYINHVSKNSLLDNVGVKEGDMLYELNGFRIDAYGDATVPWSRDKATLNDLVSRIKHGDAVSCVVYRKGERIELSFTFEVTEPNPIRFIYPKYEPVDYEIIAGMIVMQLSDNHIPLLAPHMPYLIDYTKVEKKTEPALIISHIIPGSVAQQSRTLIPGFIITEVNGEEVKTLSEFRKAVKKSLKSNLLSVKVTDKILVVFPLGQVLVDEERLSNGFGYAITKLVKELLEAVS
ncbi:MAG TPA: trypsin-like peptidase domain-containing protein [Candidatus Babeliales bacterium]|nr:trypsin-like peptidase domain-containing protein [Candidatus Babeliales bacterium]